MTSSGHVLQQGARVHLDDSLYDSLCDSLVTAHLASVMVVAGLGHDVPGTVRVPEAHTLPAPGPPGPAPRHSQGLDLCNSLYDSLATA